MSNDVDYQATIAAIATARGQGGVAIVRISGPLAWEIARHVFVSGKTFKPPQLKSGRIYHGWIKTGGSAMSYSNAKQYLESGQYLDEVILLCFKAPHSFTGEDVIEIHGHGGDYLSHQILNLCLAEGAVLAQPGEFTKRAFLAGKIDLTQAESIMDLVSAQNERLLQLATTNLKNRALGGALDDMRGQLVRLQMHLVAHTDFPDEVDPPDRGVVQAELAQLMETMQQLAAGVERNRIVREGFQIAILGMPNSGKSSLFNAMLSAERAIVTDIAGTTRDVITESFELEGVNVTLLDTAGIRDADNVVEALGIERSYQAAEQAQAVLYVYDVLRGLSAEDEAILARLSQLPDRPILLLANKLDLCPDFHNSDDHALPLSAKTGQGLPELLDWLSAQIRLATATEGAMAAISLNRRQRDCVSAIVNHLQQVHEVLSDSHLPLDLATIPLSDALYQFDRLTGRDTTEEVLDEVFSTFCVGK